MAADLAAAAVVAVDAVAAAEAGAAAVGVESLETMVLRNREGEMELRDRDTVFGGEGTVLVIGGMESRDGGTVLGGEAAVLVSESLDSRDGGTVFGSCLSISRICSVICCAILVQLLCCASILWRNASHLSSSARSLTAGIILLGNTGWMDPDADERTVLLEPSDFFLE